MMENVKELIKQKEQALLKEKKDLVEACLYAIELIYLEKILSDSYYLNSIKKELEAELKQYEAKIIEEPKEESEEVVDESN